MGFELLSTPPLTSKDEVTESIVSPSGTVPNRLTQPETASCTRRVHR